MEEWELLCWRGMLLLKVCFKGCTTCPFLRNEIDSADVFEDFVQEALPTVDLGRDRGFRATKVKRWIVASSDHLWTFWKSRKKVATCPRLRYKQHITNVQRMMKWIVNSSWILTWLFLDDRGSNMKCTATWLHRVRWMQLHFVSLAPRFDPGEFRSANSFDP